MNQMFRRPGQPEVRHDDILSQGHIDWSERVAEAISAKTAWKATAWMAMCVAAVAVGGDVWLANKSSVQTVHIVHDNIGDVIAVSSSSDTPGGPTQAQLQAALRDWITDVRSVYVDTNALKHSILSAYDLVKPGSQANADLSRFYQAKDPFVRAQTETVAVHDVVPVPPTAATIGPGGMQTWAITWIEHTESRDGQNATEEAHAGNVTFTVSPPKTVEEAKKDPDGIHIISIAWTN